MSHQLLPPRAGRTVKYGVARHPIRLPIMERYHPSVADPVQPYAHFKIFNYFHFISKVDTQKGRLTEADFTSGGSFPECPG